MPFASGKVREKLSYSYYRGAGGHSHRIDGHSPLSRKKPLRISLCGTGVPLQSVRSCAYDWIVLNPNLGEP